MSVCGDILKWFCWSSWDSLNVMLTMSCSWPEAFRNVHLVTDRRPRCLSFSLRQETREGPWWIRICPQDHRKRTERERLKTQKKTLHCKNGQLYRTDLRRGRSSVTSLGHNCGPGAHRPDWKGTLAPCARHWATALNSILFFSDWASCFFVYHSDH